MKILVTKEQLETIRENDSKKFNCDKCKHSWKIEPKDKFPYLCHMCGYDSHKKKYNYEELENFWKNYKKEEKEITEKWTEKYKKSINCSDTKGFSQRAYCQGKKKNLKESKKNDISNEEIKNITSILIDYATPEIKKYIKPYQPQLKDNDIVINYELNIHKNFDINNTKVIYVTLDIVNTDGNSIVIYEDNELDIIDLLFDYLKYMGIDNDGLYDYSFDFKRYHMKFKLDENKESEEKIAEIGYDIKGIKVALNAMSELSNTYSDKVPLTFTLQNYGLKSSVFSRTPILQLYINVETEDGEVYEMAQRNRHEISVELLGILEMFGLYNDERMSPYYNFHFNKKSSEDSFD
jgi:hypothetical protein